MDAACILGYTHSEIINASLLKLIGPQTDLIILKKAVTASSRSARVNQFILYDSHDEATPMIISISKSTVQGRLSEPTCAMTLGPSSAITLQTVFEDSFCPHALVSADTAYTINLVNTAFTRRFACSHSQAHGQSLHILQGHSDMEMWTSMLESACAGQVARGHVSVSNPWSMYSSRMEDVICVPVVEADNGPVRHVLVHFDQELLHTPTSQSHSKPNEEDITLPTPDNHAIRLRRKPNDIARVKGARAASHPAPIVVVVTRALLEGVRGLPLRRAAAEIGVSPTAFKVAMRRLGLCCWTCQRAARAAEGEAPRRHPLLRACSARKAHRSEPEDCTSGSPIWNMGE